MTTCASSPWRTPHLATSILDAGWSCPARRRAIAAVEAGRVALPGDPRSASRVWSRRRRGFASRALSDRRVDCGCGRRMDRDPTAAATILNRAGHVRWGIWGIGSPVGGLAPRSRAGCHPRGVSRESVSDALHSMVSLACLAERATRAVVARRSHWRLATQDASTIPSMRATARSARRSSPWSTRSTPRATCAR